MLEFPLIGNHSLGRPGEFDEHVSAGTFDNRSQETVSVYDGRRRGLGTSHPGILSRDIDGRYGQAVNGNLRYFRGCEFSTGVLELSLPAVEIGLNTSSLARSEEIHGALGSGTIAWRRRHGIGRRSHRCRPAAFPAGRRRPLQTGYTLCEQRPRAEQKKYPRSHAPIIGLYASRVRRPFNRVDSCDHADLKRQYAEHQDR